MQLSTVLGVMSILIAQAMANPPQFRSETASDNFSPLQWLSPSELADMPSIEQVTLEKLEKMPLEKGAEIMQKWCKCCNPKKPWLRTDSLLFGCCIYRSHLSDKKHFGPQL